MLGISLSTVAADEDTTRLLTPAEQEGFQACINLFPDNIVQFQVEKQGNEKVRLRVYTEGGTLIYTYSIKKHKCARIGFDTSKLKPGKYQYVIEKGKEEVIRKTIEKKNSDS
mgnify:CR=1 FL=1